MTFGSEAVRLLTKYSVDTVFGIPGVHTIEFYRGVAECSMRSIVPRHEQGAGFIADGYGRISGKPGVCILVSGPGVLNAATPIAQAWHDSMPLFILAASTSTKLRGRNRGPLHDIPDQSAMLEQLCDVSVTVTDPEQYAEVVEGIFANWSMSRRRPVHISIPTDLLVADVGRIEKRESAKTAREISRTEISRAVELLSKADMPVVICGGGGVRDAALVRLLVETINAPLITTGNARGILPNDHPLNVGTLLPFTGSQALISKSDLVLAIGTEFSEVDVLYTGKLIERPSKLIRIDIDADQFIEPFVADVSIEGSTSRVIPLLIGGLATSGFVSRYEGAPQDVIAARRDIKWSAQSRSHFEWLDAISAAMPKGTTVSIDSTQLAYTAHHYLPWSEPNRWIAPYGLGTLGPALPMGIGAQVAAPGEPVLVLAGDGGSLFTISEMATARDVGGPLVTVIWDNGGYSEIRDSFDRAHAPRSGVDTSAHDLVAIAKGFGLSAERVKDPEALGEAIIAGFKSSSPTVIVATEPGSLAARRSELS
jgi:thiamine pyrophosphate-dependent acetolactate synthase large subunit-like protein